MPGRLRVGGIALMENGEGNLKGRIAQIFVELRKLPRRQEALVNDGQRRKRADVTSRGKKGFGALAENGEAPLETATLLLGRGDVGVAESVKGRDVELPDFRHCFQGAAAEAIGVDGNATPASDAQALRLRGGLHGGAGFRGLLRGEESEAQSENLGQLDSLLAGAGTEKGNRY